MLGGVQEPQNPQTKSPAQSGELMTCALSEYSIQTGGEGQERNFKFLAREWLLLRRSSVLRRFSQRPGVRSEAQPGTF